MPSSRLCEPPRTFQPFPQVNRGFCHIRNPVSIVLICNIPPDVIWITYRIWPLLTERPVIGLVDAPKRTDRPRTTDTEAEAHCRNRSGDTMTTGYLSADKPMTTGYRNAGKPMTVATEAEAVLKRFDQQITKATCQVRSCFPAADTDDIRLEANVLVVTYAGLMEGRHRGMLSYWADKVSGNEPQIRGLLFYELRLDLLETFGRTESRRVPADSVDAMPPTRQPSYEPEDTWVTRIDLNTYVAREYPYLTLSAVDELSEDEIADVTGEGIRTIRRRLAVERRKALRDPYFTATDAGRWSAQLAA